MRTMRTGTIVLLSVIAGFTSGLFAGREWALSGERQMRLAAWKAGRELADFYNPRANEREWRADSLQTVRRSRMLNAREAGRFQAMHNCIVRVELANGLELEMFRVTAQVLPWGELATGWAYRAGGFPDSSTVDVVIPATRCEHIHQYSFGGTRAENPWLEPQDDDRASSPPTPPSAAGVIISGRGGR
jgi:hypothetical protein